MKEPIAPTLDYGRVAVRRRPRVRLPSQDGRTVPIEQPCIVGSAPEAAITIEDRTVSRVHAELVPRSDGLWVRDLGSKNGTFIETVRVESGLVPAGGRLRLGGATLLVDYDAPEPVELWQAPRFGPLLGGAPAMRELFGRLARVAPTDAAVLIQGETGTGKELAAQAIVEASKRAGQPLVIVDCGALPENLLEAELFGHAKGAFTGALGAKPGAIEAADGGTVFLDEIGELPLSVQPKLLRVLESKQVRRLGESHHRTVDVRFVSATHRDLSTMVNTGAFREDLYFRLAVLVVTIPPLRERREDVPLLFEHLMRGGPALGRAELAKLAARPWTGNVRELRNFAERVRALGVDEAFAMLDPKGPARAPSSAPPPTDEPAAVAEPTPPEVETSRARASGDAASISFDRPYREVREEWVEHLERAYFARLLEAHDRNVALAAQAAGVDRTYIYRLIRRYGL
jgi:DNA-binding NtrC family response regulator